MDNGVPGYILGVLLMLLLAAGIVYICDKNGLVEHKNGKTYICLGSCEKSGNKK